MKKTIEQHQQITWHLEFSVDDHTSLDDLLVIVLRDDQTVGQVRMSWGNWPFPKTFRQGGTLGEVFDILAEYGRQILNRQV